MGSFSNIAKGTFARRTVTIVIGGADVAVDVRVVSPQEEGDILAGALKFAIARGGVDPKVGDPLYDYGKALHVCLIACIDPLSSQDDPRPFFDGGMDQVLSSRVLTRAHLMFLAQHQEVWQDENAPYRINISNENIISRIEKIAGGDIDPFAELEPCMQWLLVRTMASLYIDSLEIRSASGSSSQDSSNETAPPAGS